MVYAIPKSKKADKVFEFTVGEDPTVYHLPLLKNLKPAVALRLSSEPEKAVVKLFELYCPAAFDALENNEQLDYLFKAWQQESGIDLGESSASATS